MKVQNEHLELIKAAETYLNDASLKNHIKLNVAIDNSKCLINSIASVEPEPLAKNKDSESNFTPSIHCKFYIDDTECGCFFSGHCCKKVKIT